jgi:hypothetical protein
MTMTHRLPELTVEAYVSKLPTRFCEFEPGRCEEAIAYTVTPPTQRQDPRVHRDDEYTTFVCRKHLGELIALRLAGEYPS